MIKKLQALRAKKGFTLVELIVVIAIIGVLAAILVPTMMGMVTKSRVTSLDTTTSKLKDTVTQWMVNLDTAAGKVPDEATIEINGMSGSWTIEGADGFLKNDGSAAKTMLEDMLNNDYDFTKNISAIIYVQGRKAVAAAYTDGASYDLTAFTADTLRSGKHEWNGKTAGVMDDGTLIGTYPKCELDESGDAGDDT